MMYRISRVFILLKGQRVLIAAFITLMMALMFAFLFLYGGREEHLLYTILFAMVLVWIVSDAQMSESISALQNRVADLKDKLCLAEHEAENLRLELEARQEAAKKSKAAKRKKKENSNETETKD